MSKFKFILLPFAFAVLFVSARAAETAVSTPTVTVPPVAFMPGYNMPSGLQNQISDQDKQAADNTSNPKSIMPNQVQAPAYNAVSSTQPAAALSTGPANSYQTSVSSATDVRKALEKKPYNWTYDDPGMLLSGIVLTPTAYRGRGRSSIGLNLDINAAYYIGRIYGKNDLSWTTRKKNYLDRIGLWLLTADGKMTIQSEGEWQPAIAAGALGTFSLRDSPQPKLDDPTVSIKVNSTNSMGSAYVVASKKFKKRFITNIGFMEGTFANQIPLLSEYLTDESLELSGKTGQSATSRDVLFGGFIWMLSPTYPIGLEFIIPQGAPASPKLFNLHLGTLLKMNFEVAYLTYDGGWDLLGMFQFRYNYFPRD